MTDTFRPSIVDEELRKFDAYAHAVTVIQEPHRLGHDGFMFHASWKATGLTNGSTYDVLLDVPAGTYPHLQRFSLSLGRGDVDILTYEGATTSAAGTGQTERNVNRNNTRTAALAVSSGPTVTDPGTLIHTGWAPPTSTGVGQSANGAGPVEQGEEWVLAPSTKYLVRLTNNSGATIALRVEVLWYEVGYES